MIYNLGFNYEEYIYWFWCWIAAVAKKDEHHKETSKIIKWVNQQTEYKIVVTNLILAEVVNFLKRKKFFKLANDIADIFITNDKIELYFDDQTMSNISINLFKQIDRLSYVDASSVVFCRKLDCEYLISFDTDFDGIKNITRIIQIPN